MQIKSLSRYEFAGELALTSELRPVRGAFTMTSNMMGETKNASKCRYALKGCIYLAPKQCGRSGLG